VTSPIIVTYNLRKVYTTYGKETVAVKDVSFEVYPGELFGLFGSNGAGKTTIVKMLTTLLEPSGGTAVVNGFDVVKQAIHVRASVGLATADERSFYGRLSSEQNLSFFAALQNVPRAHIKERVKEVLELFGLSQKAGAPVQSLSTGQKQRLNMARALIHDPPVLFLDEPTKSMDVQTADFVKELIRDELVARQHKTIVFISHELFEMDNFCNRVVILADGELRAGGTPEQLSATLPRRAVYRVEVEGDPDQIAANWQAIPDVDGITEISRGVLLTSFEITLANEKSDGWLQMLHAVGACGGRVESYKRVDDGSLRDVIKYFTK